MKRDLSQTWERKEANVYVQQALADLIQAIQDFLSNDLTPDTISQFSRTFISIIKVLPLPLQVLPKIEEVIAVEKVTALAEQCTKVIAALDQVEKGLAQLKTNYIIRSAWKLCDLLSSLDETKQLAVFAEKLHQLIVQEAQKDLEATSITTEFLQNLDFTSYSEEVIKIVNTNREKSKTLNAESNNEEESPKIRETDSYDMLLQLIASPRSKEEIDEKKTATKDTFGEHKLTELSTISFKDPNQRDAEGRTLLHLAIKDGKELKEVQEMIEQGANIYATDLGGNFIIHYVMQYGSLEIINWFLSLNIDLNLLNHKNQNPGQIYCDSHKELDPQILAALKRKINFNVIKVRPNLVKTVPKELSYRNLTKFIKESNSLPIDEDGNTLLHLVMKQNEKDMKDTVSLLLRNGVAMNARNKAGETFLHIAAKFNNGSVTEIFEERDLGTCINIADKNGSTPLHVAMEYKQGDIILFFLTKGADQTARNNLGETFLHIGVKAVTSLLPYILNNAKLAKCINIPDQYGYTPLDLAEAQQSILTDEIAKKKSAAILKVLKEHKAQNGILFFDSIVTDQCDIKTILSNLSDFNVRNDQKETLLHVAIKLGKYDRVDELSVPMVNRNSTCKLGNTPLHNAAKKSSKENDLIIANLLFTGAKINIINQENSTPAHIAAKNQRFANFQTLISEDIVNFQDANGNTVGHLAILNANDNDERVGGAIEYLVSKHLQIDIQNAKGQNLLDCAKEKNNTRLIEWFSSQPQTDEKKHEATGGKAKKIKNVVAMFNKTQEPFIPTQEKSQDTEDKNLHLKK